MPPSPHLVHSPLQGSLDPFTLRKDGGERRGLVTSNAAADTVPESRHLFTKVLFRTLDWLEGC